MLQQQLMKLIKTKILFDGVGEKKDYLGFEGDEIKYVGNTKPRAGNDEEVVF